MQIGASEDHEAIAADLFIVVGDHSVLPASHRELPKHRKGLPLHQVQVEDADVVQSDTPGLPEDRVVPAAVDDQNLMPLLLQVDVNHCCTGSRAGWLTAEVGDLLDI